MKEPRALGNPISILTVGPASESSDLLSCLTSVTTKLRINVAHVSPVKLNVLLRRIATLQLPDLSVVLDLQGAKIRIGQYPVDTSPPEDAVFIHANASSNPREIPVPHAEVFSASEVGDTVSLNDNSVIFEIVAVKPELIRLKRI